MNKKLETQRTMLQVGKEVLHEVDKKFSKKGVFKSTSDGLKANPLSKRKEGDSFFVIENGKRVEYVFESGVEDSNLVKVEVGSGGGLTPEQIDKIGEIDNKVDKDGDKVLSTKDFNPDGQTIVIGEDGKAKAVGAVATIPTASATVKGGIKIGDTLEIKDDVLNVKSNIITYTHSGNKEVAVSAINYSTNTFTSTAHGLVNGQEIGLSISPDCDVLKHTPFNDGWNVSNTTAGFFVINSTSNTFQLSLTNSGSPIVLSERATNDFAKWKIEESKANQILIGNINAKNIKVSIIGGCLGIERYVNVHPGTIYNGYKNAVKGALAISNGYSLFGQTDMNISIVNGFDIINHKRKTTILEAGVLKQNVEEYFLKTDRVTPIAIIEGVTFSRLKPFNNTVIIIEKIS